MTRRRFPHTQETIATQYGWTYRLVKQNAELAALFNEAIESGEWDEERLIWLRTPWTAEEFIERLKKTEWYRKCVADGFAPSPESGSGEDWPAGWSGP